VRVAAHVLADAMIDSRVAGKLCSNSRAAIITHDIRSCINLGLQDWPQPSWRLQKERGEREHGHRARTNAKTISLPAPPVPRCWRLIQCFIFLLAAVIGLVNSTILPAPPSGSAGCNSRIASRQAVRHKPSSFVADFQGTM